MVNRTTGDRIGDVPAGAEGLIYIGNSNNLGQRDLETHFTSGRTGFSTLRRTLGALLKEEPALRAEPRDPGPTSTRHYRFDPAAEEHLTSWRHPHLEVGYCDVDRDEVEGSLIAHLAAPHQYWYATGRRSGFERAVTERLGPDADLTIIETDLTAEAGHDAAEKALRGCTPPTAIFAVSDVVARGVVRYAQDHMLDVPGQRSVVGFDDTPLARWGSPSSTSISQDPHSFGVQVGGLLLRYLKNGEPTHKRVVPSIQIRASTALPPPDAHENLPLRGPSTSS